MRLLTLSIIARWVMASKLAGGVESLPGLLPAWMDYLALTTPDPVRRTAPGASWPDSPVGHEAGG
jgi:hypothetical protein